MGARRQLLLYHFSEAFANLRRGGWMTVSAIGTIAFALVVIGLFSLVSVNLERVVSDFRSRSVIVAYLQEKLQPYDRDRLTGELKQLPGVAAVTYLSKDDNLRAFQEQLGDQSDILSALPGNPLPASFELKVTDENIDIEALAGKIRRLDGIEDVDYGKQTLELLSRIGTGIRFLLLTVGAVLGLAALFIITNTIRLTVLARREEIAIMRLVGATDWYIRWPYFLEGLIEGLAASLLAMGLLYGVYRFLTWKFELLPFLPVQFTFFSVELCARLVIIGTLLGAAGALLALRHVLRLPAGEDE